MDKEQLQKNLALCGPVVQEWVWKIPFMQQSVLMAAVRGPDGLPKDHISKQLLRFLRRSFLYSAFESAKAGKPTAMLLPHVEGGGSFTGPCQNWCPAVPPTGSESSKWFIDPWVPADESMAMTWICDEYLRNVDAIPHHFHLHFMHASEILGYKHPDLNVRNFWSRLYYRMVNDMHLYQENMEEMDKRLSDVELYWRSREEVVAK